jgi:hypothetical protein
MTNFVSLAVFVILFAVSLLVAVPLGLAHEGLGVTVGVAGIVLSALVASAIKVANQWERAIVLRLGTFQGTRGPGLFGIVPVIDRMRLIDTRVLTEDIRRQEVITRDNVPVSIDGVLFFKVLSVEDAVMKIQDYSYAIKQLALTALRDVVGGVTLDELLAERERIGKMVQEIVGKQAQEWGLEVTGIRLQQIDMPEELEVPDLPSRTRLCRVSFGAGSPARSAPGGLPGPGAGPGQPTADGVLRPPQRRAMSR